MKKKLKYLVCCILVIVFCFSVSAQSLCQKGTWVFGLNPINYSFANYNTSYALQGKITSGDTLKFTGIGFALNMGIGYFIKNNVCVGAGFGSNLSRGVTPNSFVLPTQLFARYYLMRKTRCFSFTKQDNMRRFAFFIEGVISGGFAQYNYDGAPPKSKETDYSYGGKIAVGYTYVFTKHLAFEMMGMYNYLNSEQKINVDQPTQFPSTVHIQTTRGCNILVGIQGYF